MESVSANPLICEVCQKEFTNVWNKKRHLLKIHNDESAKTNRKQHIMCSVCPGENREKFSCYNDLDKHLATSHDVNIKESMLSFQSNEEFKAWRGKENREVDYVCVRTLKTKNGETIVNYNCNRSDYRGYECVGQKRHMKSGGSIHIQGVCPSRMLVKTATNGIVTVTFVETHVGHNDELRTKRLTEYQQNLIVEKLTAGVSTERIIQDARIIRDDKLDRLNLITRGDLAYLMRKFNLDKRRDADDMVATALKVEEWNGRGENYAFLFKRIGECCPGLRDEDFALAYMNGVMEKKLRDFKRIICVDGTHGTNRNNWDLTIVLVKDEKNMGFPVAFLLSNRLDQTIQEHFFTALKSRLGESIQAEFFMSDDDTKYYNAWTKVMKTDKEPRRLLCTWHVIKNWNIQGRSKIKNLQIKQDMKKKMRAILKETDPSIFLQLKETYFKHLEEEGENDFLKYLQSFYFKNEERIKMWAHCHRINAGINTNMAIESLNKVLKYNKMRTQRNIRVEKLLDLLDELVEEKMWTKIINVERPNANNYQHKVTVESHKKAEKMEGKVKPQELGTFKVTSCSINDKFYIVSIKELCDDDCRAGYCHICKICIHRYECQCPENAVKQVLCKHIHAVSLFEARSDSVVDSSHSDDDNQLQVNEPSGTELRYQEDLNHFIQESRENNKSITSEERREGSVTAKKFVHNQLLKQPTLPVQ
ncbi:uncharacterized protein LOC123686531 isoform X2 [Harmonia axyridis]|uniref:uncharacterized protein LOC123670793 isoform X2 n=1 Tax=Harmonia axyridis TaxID=115357 RepID=UPI001E277A56|nr:uncharacterized protein LOC123670793 isoform X2 [Harmonia axyridis]XP_045464538.1 uncharacterized protein LOC123673862 isoform X2 [Harmonia axyridis]XP_045465354.1 uncharacterized protein LOC123674511 isoform X2 [Harmonia axyridis]XP_045466988.1 uncharacterized protein LOC123675615 isoform X2 [Harmonia axyridis]XP_045469082.1 uncharacterized protein LOC123676870 isoform X2 [Harmonia axyridis]XP_045470100.1 uncharacterized protein LOC123677557 isoform X2 [Harmonia axyridis]XP_045476461.1 un